MYNGRVIFCLFLLFSTISYGQERRWDNHNYNIDDFKGCSILTSSFNDVSLPTYFTDLEDLVIGNRYYIDTESLYSEVDTREDYDTIYKLYSVAPASKRDLRLLNGNEAVSFSNGKGDFIVCEDSVVYAIQVEKLESFSGFMVVPNKVLLSQALITAGSNKYFYDQELYPLSKVELSDFSKDEAFIFEGLLKGHAIFRSDLKLLIYKARSNNNGDVFISSDTKNFYSSLNELRTLCLKVFKKDTVYLFDEELNEVLVNPSLERTYKRTFKSGKFSEVFFCQNPSNRNLSSGVILAFELFGSYNADTAYIQLSELPEMFFFEAPCVNSIVLKDQSQDFARKQVVKDSIQLLEKTRLTDKARKELFDCSYTTNEINAFDDKVRITTKWYQVPTVEVPLGIASINFSYRIRRVGHNYFAEFRHYNDLGCVSNDAYIEFKFADGSRVKLMHCGKIDCDTRPVMEVSIDKEFLSMLYSQDVVMIRMSQSDYFGDMTMIYPDFLRHCFNNCLK